MDLDIHEDLSGDTQADHDIQRLTESNNQGDQVNYRPVSAPPKRMTAHDSPRTKQLSQTIHGMTLQTLPPRPESAKPQRQQFRKNTMHAKIQERRDRPVSAPLQNKSNAPANSKTYLRQAADKKKEKDREFAIELFREKIDTERKIALKITQANKLMRRQNSKKTYYLTKNRDDFAVVRVIEENQPERLMNVDTFNILLNLSIIPIFLSSLYYI
ncbi:hypothetical protein THRCLA_05772 [Thraustotheca clavata]|uniref:Uncharacterized protein n=1 Tax=Thraustotheca clavata TaxID=74557 RepID=A0A1V9ZT79_9STRA|nr:hypothetical protein THRCLA_05772 [Thraustotheca clavata]